MKTKTITLSAIALALSACDNAYTNWELPNVHRKNQPIVAPATTPARTPRVQAEFEKPKPAALPAPKPVAQQPVAPKTVVVAPKPQPVTAAPSTKHVDKAAMAIESLRSLQIQPEFEAPKPRPVQMTAPQPEQEATPHPVQEATPYDPRPVMTQAQKETFPVMPGQNRALKRRR